METGDDASASAPTVRIESGAAAFAGLMPLREFLATAGTSTYAEQVVTRGYRLPVTRSWGCTPNTRRPRPVPAKCQQRGAARAVVAAWGQAVQAASVVRPAVFIAPEDSAHASGSVIPGRSR